VVARRDAELDEGAVTEAMLDPLVAELARTHADGPDADRIAGLTAYLPVHR